MIFLSQVLYACETVLRFALLAFVVRGPFRKYLVFSIYVAAAFAGDLIESFSYYKLGSDSPAYRQVYWTENIALDFLLFLVVIALTYNALQDNPLRPKAAKVLGVIAVAGLAL